MKQPGRARRRSQKILWGRPPSSGQTSSPAFTSIYEVIRGRWGFGNQVQSVRKRLDGRGDLGVGVVDQNSPGKSHLGPLRGFLKVSLS